MTGAGAGSAGARFCRNRNRAWDPFGTRAEEGQMMWATRESGMMALAVLAVLGTTACASAGGRTGMAGSNANAVPRQKPISLTISNQNFADMDVYVFVGDTPERLTTVRSLNTVRVTLPVNVAVHGDVQLLLDPIGGFNSFTTDPIVVNPGETIHLTVEQPLPMSNWTVD